MKKILGIILLLIIVALTAVFISAYSKYQNYNSTNKEMKLTLGGSAESNKESNKKTSLGESTSSTDNVSKSKNIQIANKISRIATSIENQLIEGKTLDDLVIINTDMTNEYASKFAFLENPAYAVGSPNYTQLGIKKKDYQDSYGNEFIIGILSNEKKYQILGMQKGEIDSKKISLMGNYSARRYSGNGGNVAGLIFNPETGEPYQNGDIIK